MLVRRDLSCSAANGYDHAASSPIPYLESGISTLKNLAGDSDATQGQVIDLDSITTNRTCELET